MYFVFVGDIYSVTSNRTTSSIGYSVGSNYIIGLILLIVVILNLGLPSTMFTFVESYFVLSALAYGDVSVS